MKPAAPESTAPMMNPMAARADSRYRENGDNQSDDGDGEILTGEISLRTFTDKTCYFTHTLVALIGSENALVVHAA